MKCSAMILYINFEENLTVWLSNVRIELKMKSYVIINKNPIQMINQQKEKLTLRMKKKVFRKVEGNLYSTFEVIKKETEFYGKLFDQEKIKKYKIEEHLEIIKGIITQTQNLTYPQAFLKQQFHNQDNYVLFLSQPYQCTLGDYLRQHRISQQEGLNIFSSVLKAAYSLILEGYELYFLKADNFVKVRQKWKMQSFMNSTNFSSTLNSQYLVTTQNLPPEGENHEQLTNEDKCEWIVWSLGCLLIHILTGEHRLTNNAIFNKFKDQPFSFEKIGVKSQGLSQQVKERLGQMCHYNRQKRTKFKDLVKDEFFSKQVSYSYLKHTQSKQEKRDNSNEEQIMGSNEVKEQQQKQSYSIQIEQAIASSGFKASRAKLLNSKQFLDSLVLFKKVAKKQIPEKEKKVINEKELNKMVESIKNEIDKAELLIISGTKVESIGKFIDKNLLKNPQALVKITKYALYFLALARISCLSRDLEEGKVTFEPPSQWKDFLKTSQYLGITNLVSRVKRDISQLFKQYRQLVMEQNNDYIPDQNNDKYKVRQFVFKKNPPQTTFNQIKNPFRKILKNSYDLIVKQYSRQKKQDLARLGMYITYCLTLDKIYEKSQFSDNFRFFFQWSRKQPENYIQLFEFQRYIDNAPQSSLVMHSKQLMKKYFLC